MTKLCGKLNEGASFCSSWPVSTSPVASIAARSMMSTGTAVSVALRLPARLPVTLMLSRVLASTAGFVALSCAQAGAATSADKMAIASAWRGFAASDGFMVWIIVVPRD